jgi:sec-independent protein translocase protein TatC
MDNSDKYVEQDQEVEMSFLDHLEVLRWHLVRSAIVILAVTVLAFINKSFVFDKVVLGPMHPDFFTYRVMCRISELI